MKRRDFLQTGTVLAAGVLLNKLGACSIKGAQASGSDFGLQLYTLRDVLPKDPKAILKQVASFGYKQIESYEGPSGMFWGMTPKEFKSYMDDLGMTIVSSHCDINKDFERKAAQAKEAGLSYLLCPWLGPQKTLDDYKKAADTFNRCGEICRREGLRFGYHNHDYTFKQLDGQFPQDVLMQNTNAELVDYEMDIYWVVTAGQDPIAWINKYPNRFTLSHVKDRSKTLPATETNASVVLGTGTIDFANVLKAARAKGMKYFIVEQERYDNTTPIAAVEANAAYMKKLDL